MKILIADDNEYIRELLNRMIEDAGYSWENAENGKQCLDLLNQSTFDVLFLDLIMPVMDGESVLKNIGNTLNKGIDVIIMSSQDDERAIEEVLKLGATAYLTKPLSIRVIQDVLATLGSRIGKT
ncbi:MAG: response regulator [Verrucomicrobiota bacterium]